MCMKLKEFLRFTHELGTYVIAVGLKILSHRTVGLKILSHRNAPLNFPPVRFFLGYIGHFLTTETMLLKEN